MIVDQADDVAAPAAPNGRRHPRRFPASDHPSWAGPRPVTGDGEAGSDGTDAAPAPSGLAGLWPAAPTGEPRTARRRLAAEPASAKEARAFTRETLAEWGLDGVADDVQVAVSELVTNALRHGVEVTARPLPPQPIQLVLIGHPRRLLVTVTDPGRDAPEPHVQDPGRFGEGGRGLLVVSGISDAWGWAPLGTGGKAVWAAFELEQPS